MRDNWLRAILVLAGLCGMAAGDDWPQWRGSSRDGVWRETGIISQFEGDDIPIRWRVSVSNGYNGPTVAEGGVYVMDRVTEPREVERVHCFDARTGSPVWSRQYACEYEKIGYTDGPRAAISIDDGRAYSLGAMGHLHCWDAETGDVIWSHDLREVYNIRMPTWGIAASPLIEDGLLIIQIGGRPQACIVALDKISGRPRWRAIDDQASYSAPIIVEQAGRRVLVCLTGNQVVGLNPMTGRTYWRSPFPASRMPISIATPVLHDGYLFFSSFYDGSLVLRLQPDALAVEEVWRQKGPNERNTRSLHCCISTPVIRDGYIYGVDSYGELRCLDLRTGRRIWESLEAVPKARWANIHFVEKGRNIWMFNERGELIIARLSPQGFDEIDRAQLIEPTEGQLGQRGGVCWSHPAFAHKCVYARNDRELVCADLSAHK